VPGFGLALGLRATILGHDRAHGADLGTQPPAVAPGIDQAIPAEGADDGPVAAKGIVDSAYATTLHAGPDAFATEDALIRVDDDIGMAVVHWEGAIFGPETLRLQLEAQERGDFL